MQVFTISILYYIAWFACVLLASHAYPVWAALSHILFGLYIWHITDVKPKSYSLRFAIYMSIVGLFVDHILWYGDIISFPNHALCWGISPLWMTSLWFTLTLLLLGPFNHILKSLTFALLLGALGGPISYMIGAHQTKAMNISVSLEPVFITLSFIWITCMYILYKMRSLIYT